MGVIMKTKDSVWKRMGMALGVLIFFAITATGPLMLSIHCYNEKIWLLQGMDYKPDMVSNIVVGSCLVAVFLAGLIGTLMGLYEAYKVLVYGIKNDEYLNPHATPVELYNAHHMHMM
jgi:hypothetical protein